MVTNRITTSLLSQRRSGSTGTQKKTEPVIINAIIMGTHFCLENAFIIENLLEKAVLFEFLII